MDAANHPLPMEPAAPAAGGGPAPGEPAPGEAAPGEAAPGEPAPGEPAPGEPVPPSPLGAALEALLFAAHRPLSLAELARWLGVTPGVVQGELHRMQRTLEEPNRGIQLVCEAGGWRLLSKPQWGPLIQQALHPEAGEGRDLSRAALEVLAIVAYRQPITRAAVDEIRGVRSDRLLARLVEEGLVEVAGRAEGPGRPLLFRTTPKFLEFVGLESLDQLPPVAVGETPDPLHIPGMGRPR